MYRVVIIDDEPIIVEGLSRSIKWDKYNCEIVGSAYNGLEGLELVEEKKPDIVFSDIRMPNMDGLSMIASIKSAHPNTEVTILTGFQDFEYARSAIKLGVTRFLVKPSKMDELNEAVESMVKNLDEIYKDGKKSVDEIPEGEDDDKAVDNEASSFLVNNALKYMEEHYTEKLKLQDVAEHVYVSQWHLSKLLNRYKEQSFSDILNNIRIEKAKELLKDPALRIGDVAEMVGFLDMAHFSRVFKRQTGQSANEYRNTIK
ncbi:MAG: response regulator [Lachnospiraceae bacterium]|nr:response regulator [Lachnospiraceae bacterium]